MAGGAIVGAIIGAVAGTVIFSIHADEWSQELEKHYRFYRDELGESAWSSYAQAFNEWDAPWWQKAILDSAYDPLFWIGWGGATAVGQKLKTIGYGAKGLKGAGARVGHLISSFEQGYCSGMDAIFKAGTQVVAAPIKSAFWLTGAGYTIPRTYTMMARNFARSSMMNFKAVVERLYPEARSLKGLTPKDVKDAAEFCIRAVNTSPMDGNNLAVRAGANLMEFGYLDDIAAGRMMKAMTGELLWDTPRLARFNNQLADFLSGQGERITAGRMLGELGVEATEQTVKELADKLIKFREATSQAAMKAITGDTADAMILSIFNRLESTRYANLHSPFTKYMQQAGRTSSWHSRVADKVLYSAQLIALERKVVMPIARHQLLFSQFGPWAYGETMCRSFLGGAEVMHPSKYSGVEETNRLLKGLAGAPHELRMFEKGFKRMSQTVVDPKTGHTVVYKGGKIPFITRDVTIPDKVPILGGKKIGARVSIAGRDFHIGSFGDQYDFWAYFSSNQLAFDYQVHYMKALAELDPDNMGRIARIMSDNKHLLDDISSLSKADAQDIMRVLGQEATISPTDIRFHADIDVLEYQRRQISRDLNRVMDNLNDVRAMTKKSIESEVLDGSMFSKGTAGIDESIANKVAAEREMSLVGLEHQIKALQSEADMFIANPPKNLQEFMGDMQNITSHLEAVGETMHDFRRLTELRKAKLMPAEFDAFEVGSAKTLARYMDTAEESLAKIINQLSDNAKTILDPAQLGRLNDLADISRLELQNILATRHKIADIEAVIPRTPKKARDARFWQQQRSQKALIWDEFDSSARRFKAMRLGASRNFLDSVGQPAYVPDYVPEVVDQLSPNHLAYLYGVTGDDLYRGLTRVQHQTTVRPKEDFIIFTRSQADAYAAKLGKTADQLGFTNEAIGDVYDQMWRSLGVDPTILSPDHPTLLQLEEIRQELHRLHAANKIPESDVVKWRQYINKVADDVGELPIYKDAPGGTTNWWAAKEASISKAREMHKLSYPTYDDANIIDESMRAIFPFWNYELFRWRWIPRTFMRTPGTLSGLARYMHYTDTGYTPIPGTDLQINPLRGTVWLGGLRSFWRRDFPEYHDAAPAMEFMHYIGRAGFFPGVHVMLPIVLFGDPERVGGVPQLGQLSPRWVKTSLSGLRALSPEHIGRVLEIVYPDRFRDYMSMVTLASWGHDGDEIWKKKKQNIKLTEEEEKLWLKAVNEVDGLKGVLMNQTGLFRIRPQEFGEIRREMHLAIEEATGVPVSVQEWIDKTYPVTGKRFTDYFHLDIQQQALLYQWETYRRYQGIMTPLYPSSWQALDIRISDYYQELSRVFEETRYHGRYDEDGKLLRPSMVDINRDLVEGNISPDSWRSQRSSMQQGLAEAAYILGQTPLYKDVPKTFEERAKLLEERGIVTPTQTPDQELLYYYYELKPDYKYDWEMDRMELDFDTYYAHIDALLESLSPQHRERLLERIQNDWTPMELLYWEFSREYARPYRNLREIVLRSYTPEQQQIIRRFEVARGDERTELQEVMGPDGKLISSFQRKLREARLSLRMMDPELDAWLNFFGTTDKLVTAKAKEVYADLRKQYLTDSMIGSAKQ